MNILFKQYISPVSTMIMITDICNDSDNNNDNVYISINRIQSSVKPQSLRAQLPEAQAFHSQKNQRQKQKQKGYNALLEVHDVGSNASPPSVRGEALLYML